MGILKKHPAILMGLGITVIFLALGFLGTGFFDSLEYPLYDMMMKYRGEAKASKEIVIVNIDNESIEKLGRWPWPRGRIANGINKINSYKPKIIGLNIICSEKDSGSEQLKKFQDFVERDIRKMGNARAFIKVMSNIRLKLDNDRQLKEAIRASGKVVLPVFFKPALMIGGKKEIQNEDLIKLSSIQDIMENKGAETPAADDISMPITSFFKESAGVGHVNLDSDIDGKVRHESLLFDYKGYIMPSFTLRLIADYMGVEWDKVQAKPGESITIGPLEIPVNEKSELLINFKGSKDPKNPEGSFDIYSYFDVVNNKILPDVFDGRIVIISPSASGMDTLSTPIGNMPLGEYSANVIWAIIHQKYVQKPAWDKFAGIGITIFLGLVISFLLPRLKAVFAGIVFLLLACLLIGGASYMFIENGIWIRVTNPVFMLFIGYIGVVTVSYFSTETSKEKVEGESAETNRMLGVSFQDQGMLDMAFDKFRKVPVNDEMKDVLYNLGLDFERKRQFNKAASVYGYIEEHDGKYKDVVKKREKLQQASENMVFGDSFLGGSTAGDGLLTSGSDTRPTLGRYEVIKQLGKGAMGIVYLGQDPRINRTTAIKTFHFMKDFEPEEARELKDKFFREAESAGTLSHPNIVTIYDAGEEHDLAYIAMEFLEGEDMSKYVKKKNLLPMRKVIDYVADIADALDYAHQQGVVHRDIKPANIMLIKSGVVKVTDFGIARITASSQTQTGVVKGTPHYMSPEQISGEKVDGRSDIFSLGVMLFQLLTGDIPFKGDSPAALMHQIMNKPHPDPKSVNPKLLKPHGIIIDKAMEKDKDKRYQRANQMSGHLRALGKKIDALKAKKAAG